MSGDILSQLQQATSEQQKTWIITSAFLKNLPSRLAEATLAAAVPHWFDVNVLATLLTTDSVESKGLYESIKALPFSEPFGNLGYALHDLTRSGILFHLTAAQTDAFQTYSQWAYQYFCQFDNPQNKVESIYHLLATDKVIGLEKFKEQMKIYRQETNFSAANNLIRNAKELGDLGLFTTAELAEIDLQKSRTGRELIRHSERTATTDKERYLIDAIKAFNPSEDISCYKQLNPTQLYDIVIAFQTNLLVQNLENAKRSGDVHYQKIWLTELGDVELDKKNYEAALQHYNEILVLEKNSKEAIAHRGETYRLLGNYKAALADFNRAVELDSNNTGAIARRGATHGQIGDYEAALADFNRAIKLDNTYAGAITSRGVTYRLLGQYEAALADFNHAVELDSNDAGAIACRGETYRLLGQYEAALADFNRAIKLDSNNAWAIVQRGETYRRLGQYGAALADFNRAIELDEKYASAIAHRGVTYRLLGQYEAALTDFNCAIELDSNNAWAITSRGVTYGQTGDYKTALVDFNRAIELDSNNVWAIACRGETYRRLGRYKAALTDFNRAIELDSNNAWAIARRDETYWDTYWLMGSGEMDYHNAFLDVLGLGSDGTEAQDEAELLRSYLPWGADGQRLMGSSKMDHYNAFPDVLAGSSGTEAQDGAELLARVSALGPDWQQ